MVRIHCEAKACRPPAQADRSRWTSHNDEPYAVNNKALVIDAGSTLDLGSPDDSFKAVSYASLRFGLLSFSPAFVDGTHVLTSPADKQPNTSQIGVSVPRV
jgi:hypothetical protein